VDWSAGARPKTSAVTIATAAVKSRMRTSGAGESFSDAASGGRSPKTSRSVT
jgi:hypothetical protein